MYTSGKHNGWWETIDIFLISVLEEEDERGVAHIVEHLAFSATKKYTNQIMISLNFLKVRVSTDDLEKERGAVMEEHIVQQFEYSNTGATELILSTGMRVCYKCTDFFDDQVLFTGFSYGGLSELPENEYFSCSMGSTIAGEIGVFGYRPSVLMDMLAGKRAEVGTKLGAYMRTFSGDCSPSDLETALQLVCQLFITDVEPREEDIKIVMQMAEEAIRAQERDPYTAFANRVRKLNYGNSYFFRIGDLKKVDPFKGCEYFNNCFKDPSTFTVVIVGNIDPAIACPLILQYLGGIPRPLEPVFHCSRDDLKGLPFTFPSTIISSVFGGPEATFWNKTIGRRVLADVPSSNCGTCSSPAAARPNVFLLNWIINPSRGICELFSLLSSCTSGCTISPNKLSPSFSLAAITPPTKPSATSSKELRFFRQSQIPIRHRQLRRGFPHQVRRRRSRQSHFEIWVWKFILFFGSKEREAERDGAKEWKGHAMLVCQLFITDVEPREEDIKIVMQMAEEAIRAQERDPYTAFANRVRKLNYGNSYFFRIGDLKKVDPFKACEYFNNCFKDPSTFTVVIVGNIDPAIACPLILQYLGGIPRPLEPVFHCSRDDLKGLPFTFPSTIIRKRKALARGDRAGDRDQGRGRKKPYVRLEGFEDLAFEVVYDNESENKTREGWFELQSGMGIYSAGVSVFLGGNKPSIVDNVRGDISVNFSCDPDISTTVVDLALEEILCLPEEGPTDEDVLTILEIEQRAHENGLLENYDWLDRILRSYQSRIYFGDVGTSFEYTVVILMPQRSCFKKLGLLIRSAPNRYSRDAKRKTSVFTLRAVKVGPTLKKAPNTIKEIRKFAQKAMGTKDVRVDVNTSGAEASEVSQGGLEFTLLAREMMMKMQKKSSTLLLLLLKSHWKG
ncbi:hypothetical protein TEA_019677 [Camellia sinensis var. sinensis]|uniref:Peptidase M16 N-terminal domain-containing protein n=1 Tax=Camellia sinensis var. sinensis TaxID=542762 RepID=A0A4S4EBY6_CAMSN|nr:hypothetical protein TEA_019677 [Camellia sinensis var. sinensis]